MRGRVGLVLTLALTGCGMLPAVDLDGPVASVPPPPFEDCVAEEYLYFGENTLAALGLDAVTRAPLGGDAHRVGKIWVTADFLPLDHGPPGGLDTEMVRMFCASFPDGSGLSSWPVDETWRPPVPVVNATSDASTTAPPWPLLLGAVAAVIAVGLSIVAFRQRR